MKQQAHIIDFNREKEQLKNHVHDQASLSSLDESEKRFQTSLQGMSHLGASIRQKQASGNPTSTPQQKIDSSSFGHMSSSVSNDHSVLTDLNTLDTDNNAIHFNMPFCTTDTNRANEPVFEMPNWDDVEMSEVPAVHTQSSHAHSNSYTAPSSTVSFSRHTSDEGQPGTSFGQSDTTFAKSSAFVELSEEELRERARARLEERKCRLHNRSYERVDAAHTHHETATSYSEMLDAPADETAHMSEGDNRADAAEIPNNTAVDSTHADTTQSEASGDGDQTDDAHRVLDYEQIRMRFDAYCKKRRKAHADKQFDKTVDTSADTSANADDQATPHAAVYKGKMGHNQRKSERMQNDRWQKRRNARFDKLDAFVSAHKPRTYAMVLVAGCVVAGALLVYQPAKQYYTALRTQQQVQAQYDVQQAHADALQDEVDSLQTDEGIEDRARQQYGMVKNGENSVRVQGDGTSQEDATQQSTNANASASIDKQNHVSAPDTWYSGVLDTFFGYNGDSTQG